MPKNVCVELHNFLCSIKPIMSAPYQLAPPQMGPPPPRCEPRNPHFHILPFPE